MRTIKVITAALAAVVIITLVVGNIYMLASWPETIFWLILLGFIVWSYFKTVGKIN